MVTEVGEMVTLLASELLKETVTPPAGATAGRVTCTDVDCPRTIDEFAVTPREPAPCTLTCAEALVTLGLVAVIVAEPVLTPVTAKVTELVPWPMDTVAGTETTPD